MAINACISSKETFLILNLILAAATGLCAGISFLPARIAGQAELSVKQTITRLTVVTPTVTASSLVVWLFTRLGGWSEIGAAILASAIILLLLVIPVLMYREGLARADEKNWLLDRFKRLA